MIISINITEEALTRKPVTQIVNTMEKFLFCRTDCESIMSQIKHQEKQLKLKRRWLLGLPTSKSDHKQLKNPKILNSESLPESLLREDDMFYETIKSHVERAFGVCEDEKGWQVSQASDQLVGTASVMGVLDSSLDALTNKGLYLIVKILAGGSVKFEITRKKMKKFIRVYLQEGFRNKRHNHGQKEIFRQLYKVLNDPQIFRENNVKFFTPTIQSHRAAAVKVLNKLQDLSHQTLMAMRRKLRCSGGAPELQPRKSGWSRDHLINLVRKTSEKMLSELGEEDELQEPLAKAMAIAGLSSKLSPGYQNCSAVGFYQFSPEIKSLQNEIVKAIWLLKTKVRFSVLKTLQLLLDPDADVPNGCLRTAIKKLLTEYLFECCDLDTIPKSLSDALTVINRSSRIMPPRCFPKEEIENEVECILNVSANIKQIALNLLPYQDFDQDFSDAYMEELEESDDGDDYDGCGDDYGDCDNDKDDNSKQMKVEKVQQGVSHTFDSDYEVESTAESMPVHSKPSTSAIWENGSSSPCARITRDCTWRLELQHLDGVNSSPPFVTPALCQGSRLLNGTVSMDIKQYQVKAEILEVGENTGFSSEDPSFRHSSKCLLENAEFGPCEQATVRNHYLSVQEVCDDTSMVAYNLIGRLLEKFAEEEDLKLDRNDNIYLRVDSLFQQGTPVKEEKWTSSEEDLNRPAIVRVVKELMPSLPKSQLERLEELMGT